MIAAKRYSLVLLLLGCNLLLAQSKKEVAARRKAAEAIGLTAQGQYDASIKLLEEAVALDPDNIDYRYEMGHAYYLSQNYQKSIVIVAELIHGKSVNDYIYQLLGNSYNLNGQPGKAITTYHAGLIKNPRSGRLYLELGNIYKQQEDYSRAISFYEQGIYVDPGYPNNYLHLSRLFLSSEEKVWGMIYGELFMNLEKHTHRTHEMSKLLYDAYKSQIHFTSDTSVVVSFSRDTVNPDQEKNIIPFGQLYEQTLMMSLGNEKVIDINSLDRIRTAFITNYFATKSNKKYPNILFSYQNNLLKEGYLEAYNHWLLMQGDPEAFARWKADNEEKWKEFMRWAFFAWIGIDDNNKFQRN
jgi:tetratricopeptide (TPR) repeat protein